MTSIIYNILSPHIPDWQKYALRYFEEQLEAVNLTGACYLDEQETPELPQQLFMQLNEDWDAEPSIVQELLFAIQSTREDKSTLVEELQSAAAQLRDMDSGLLDNLVLQQDYAAAQEETLWEKLTDTNYQDVMAFYHELSATLHHAMFEAIEWHMAKVIDETANRINTLL